ncbi:hypothetical protein JW979_04395 [bacterium]|nr:hypothetical protein [candidate division CSSED10-310 bacterium]
MVIFISIGLLVLLAFPVSADPFVDRVADVQYGTGAGFGQDQFPEIVLGGPEGAGEFGGSNHILSLGDGGWIILEFTDNVAENGPGPDLIVFENPFYVNFDPLNVFSEVAFVEVSQDGETFFRFPNDYNPDGIPENNPANWTGFAGVSPVIANSQNGIDPINPDVAGGDVFDLSDVGLDWIRYIRIVDTDEPPNAASDDDGDEIYDYGWPGGTTAGFDLDAVAAIYSTDPPTPIPTQTVTPTETETPTSTPTATPTAIPERITADIILSKKMYLPGDNFLCTITLYNHYPQNVNANVYLLLDCHGIYFFYPSWNQFHDYLTLSLNFSEYRNTIIDFIWPDIHSEDDDLHFWCAVLDIDNQLISNIDKETFGYRQL